MVKFLRENNLNDEIMQAIRRDEYLSASLSDTCTDWYAWLLPNGQFLNIGYKFDHMEIAGSLLYQMGEKWILKYFDSIEQWEEEDEQNQEGTFYDEFINDIGLIRICSETEKRQVGMNFIKNKYPTLDQKYAIKDLLVDILDKCKYYDLYIDVYIDNNLKPMSKIPFRIEEDRDIDFAIGQVYKFIK